ncbi:hypothetical protein Tco_1040775, partial [Tanacetum coccineum]
VPMNQPQPVVSIQGTHKSTPRAHRTPTLTITIRQQKVVNGEKDDDNSTDRLKPRSHKDNPEHFDDDDKDKEKVDEEEGGEMGSLEIRTEEMQTPIPTKLRSPRTILSSDKNITQELTDNIPLSTTTTSNTPHSKRCISSKYSHLPGALHRMCRRQGYMIQNMEQKCVTTKQFWNTHKQVNQVLHEEVPDLVSQEFNAQAPKIIEELFKNYIQNQANDPALWKVLKRKFEKSSASNTSCRDDDIHSQRHDDHQEDDAPPKGEKRVKRHKISKSSKSARGSLSKHSAKDFTTYVSNQQQQQEEWDAWVEETVIDEDEVILEDETPELIIELQDVDKRVPTIYDYARMKVTLNDALSNQFKNTEEYAYHLKQTRNFMENQIVWESRQEDIRRPVPRPLEKKYILSLYKIHAERFPKVDLEKKMNRWSGKEFKNFNEEAQLTIQHWKDS